MENKANEKREEQKLIKNEGVEKPAGLLERDKSKEETSAEKNAKHADLEKFKSGELGAAHIGYNDDGSTHGESQKLDIDTEADPKQV